MRRQATEGGAMADTMGLDGDPAAILQALRRSIDNIDAALIHMLAERFRCTQAVGRLKARHAMPPADPAREAQQVARLRRLADDAALDPDFAEKFLAFVIREVIRHHEAFAANGATAAATPANRPAQAFGLPDDARLLLLLRHAKAVPSDEGNGEAFDRARELAPRGQADAAALGAWLHGSGYRPDHILVSSSVRTRETLDGLGLPGATTPTVTDALYLAGASDLQALLRDVPEAARSVLLVGHNPGLHELAWHLASAGPADRALDRGFPTCAFAAFAVRGPWRELAPRNVQLLRVGRPGELD